MDSTHRNSVFVSPPVVAWPRVAASAAIFRDGRVLIAERGGGPGKGSWSLPGGKIEPGETAVEAALREVREETGLEVALAGLLDVHNAIRTDSDGAVLHHYVICVYYGRWVSGEPLAATDISDARFVGLEDLGDYPLTDGALKLIREAHRRLGP
jgi:8-oxo-dGTP diphosphatase